MKLNDMKIKQMEKRIDILKTGNIPEGKLNKGKIVKSHRLENLISDKKLLNYKNENLTKINIEKITKNDKEIEPHDNKSKVEKDLKSPKETPVQDKSKLEIKSPKETPGHNVTYEEKDLKIKRKMFGAKEVKNVKNTEKKVVNEKETPETNLKKDIVKEVVEESVKHSVESNPSENQLLIINFKQNKKNIPIQISSTQKILHSELPKKIDKYKEIKEILKDEKKQNKELARCEAVLQELKNCKYTEIQDEFFKFLEIDINYSFRGKMKGYIYPTEGVFNPNSSIVEETLRKIEKKKIEKNKKKLEKEKEKLMKEVEVKKENFTQNEINQKNFQRLRMKENKYSEINEKRIMLQKEKTRSMSWEDLIKVDLEYFVTNKDDDFNPEQLLENNIQENDENDSLFTNSLSNKNDTNIQARNINSSNQYKPQKSIINPISSLDKSSNKENVLSSTKQKVKNNISTEQRAKEFEKELGEKKEKVIQINNTRMEKGLNKIKKFYKE